MTTDQGTPPKADFQKLSQRVDLIIKHKDQLIEILQEKVERLPEIEEENKAMREKIARLETETHIANQQIEKLKSDLLTGNHKELNHLHEENLQLRDQLTSIEEKAALQASQNQEMQAKLQAEHSLETKNISEENVKLKGKLAFLEGAAKLSKDQVEELKSLLHEDKFEKIQQLHLENLVLRKKLEGIPGEKALLSDQRAEEISYKEGESPEDIQKLRQDNVSLREKIELLRSEIESLKNEAQITNVEVIEAQPGHFSTYDFSKDPDPAKTFVRLESDLNSRDKEVANLKSRLGELLIVQNRADEIAASLRQKIKSLEDELSAQQKKYNTLLEGIEGANQTTREKTSEINHLNGKIDELRNLISLKSIEFDGQLIDLDQERRLVSSLQRDLESERAQSAKAETLREELKKNLEREAQLNEVIASLRKGIASLNEKFSNFLFEQKARKEISYVPSEPGSSEKFEETAPKSFQCILPLCFPERPPKILKAKKKSLPIKEPSRAESAKPFLISRPINFFKTFLQVALPPINRMSGLSKNLRIKLDPEVIIGKRHQKLEMSLEKINFLNRYKSFNIGYFPVPGIILLRNLPGPNPKMLFGKHQPRILIDSFDLFSSFLLDNLRQKLHKELKIIFISPRNNVMFNEFVKRGFFEKSLEHKRFLRFEQFQNKTREKKQKLVTPRIPLPQILPRGSIGMLLKGMSESLISLTSRLDQSTKKAS